MSRYGLGLDAAGQADGQEKLRRAFKMTFTRRVERARQDTQQKFGQALLFEIAAQQTDENLGQAANILVRFLKRNGIEQPAQVNVPIAPDVNILRAQGMRPARPVDGVHLGGKGFQVNQRFIEWNRFFEIAQAGPFSVTVDPKTIRADGKQAIERQKPGLRNLRKAAGFFFQGAAGIVVGRRWQEMNGDGLTQGQVPGAVSVPGSCQAHIQPKTVEQKLVRPICAHFAIISSLRQELHSYFPTMRRMSKPSAKGRSARVP